MPLSKNMSLKIFGHGHFKKKNVYLEMNTHRLSVAECNIQRIESSINKKSGKSIKKKIARHPVRLITLSVHVSTFVKQIEWNANNSTAIFANRLTVQN